MRESLSQGVSLSVTMERRETDCLIRLGGVVNLTHAEELKQLLLEGLVSGKDVQLNLEGVEEIDVTVMQLLWAVGREADRTGVKLVSHLSEAAAAAANDAGFGQLLGDSGSGVPHV